MNSKMLPRIFFIVMLDLSGGTVSDYLTRRETRNRITSAPGTDTLSIMSVSP